MRHHDANRKFNRSAGQRTALMRGLAAELISHGRIMTTEAKAKELMETLPLYKLKKSAEYFKLIKQF